MSRKFVKFLIIVSVFTVCYSIRYLRKEHRQNFSLLIDFACATAKDELEKHPEMQTIAMVELENNFPSGFSGEVLKCLPPDVAKVNLNPHTHRFDNISMTLPKQTMVIYAADKVEWSQIFLHPRFSFKRNFPVVHFLSKHLIVSSDRTKNNETMQIIKELRNIVQIFEENQKVITRGFDRTGNLTTLQTFENPRRENPSLDLFFPDKAQNLNGQELNIVFEYDEDGYAFYINGNDKPSSKWTPYLDIIAEKLNATLKFTQVDVNHSTTESEVESRYDLIIESIIDNNLDFYLNYPNYKFELESYNNMDWCFLVPLPEPFSITELILFLPLDQSCWMWLGITIAVSTLVWRISEGHWNFLFGAFSYFMGQAQLSVRIRTDRLAMKILLQLLIFAFFIFSNGYQSLVTSFMLDPVRLPLLKSINELLDSDLNIQFSWVFDELYMSSPKYRKANQSGRVIEKEVFDDGFEKMVELNRARAQPCKMFKLAIESKGDGKSWQGIYLIPEVAYSYAEDLYIKPYHPYLDKFQEIMDRTFEAGLHQAWERLHSSNWREINMNRTKPEEKQAVLDFKLIAPFFLILVFGFGAAFVALLFEIFWHDFVMELTGDFFRRKWNEIFGIRRINVTRTKKVRIRKVKRLTRRSQV